MDRGEKHVPPTSLTLSYLFIMGLILIVFFMMPSNKDTEILNRFLLLEMLYFTGAVLEGGENGVH